MQRSSSSSNSSVNGPGVYNCFLCPKVFNSRRARGGHQTVHRQRPIVKTYKGKKLSELPPALAAALAHHVPDDNGQSKAPNNQPTESTTNPMEVIEGDAGSSMAQPINAVQPKLKTKGEPSNTERRPYKKRADKAELHTIDYLAEFEGGQGSSTAAAPSEKDPCVPVPRGRNMEESDDLNLELQLGPGNPIKVLDLGLKLGL